LLKNAGEGSELELFCKIFGWGSSIVKGKYLKVENIDKAIAFFIGGAADKESYYFQGPFNNVQDAQVILENSLVQNPNSLKYYSSYYLDYSDAYDDVLKKITSNIFDKSIPLFIIGHSLGGWNGAHLSQILTDSGYKVKMLITLDPVGKGFLVYVGSNIYATIPKPKADFWINLKAVPSKPDQSDSVAEFGERWNVKTGPNINNEADLNHYNAKKMFTIKLSTGKSVFQYLFDNVTTLINQK
jgi:pimeloyl-ACP methyl ester carboxylesterase